MLVSGWHVVPQGKGSWFIPVQAGVRVAPGLEAYNPWPQVPAWIPGLGAYGGNQSMLLSHCCFPLPLSLPLSLSLSQKQMKMSLGEYFKK